MSEEELPEKEQSVERSLQWRVSRGSVGAGVGWVLLLYLLHFLLFSEASVMGFNSLMVIGLTQAIYVIPAFIIARWKGYEDTAKGIVIAASITALLNTACTAIEFFA